MSKDNQDEKKKRIKPSSLKNFWRVFLIEALLFCLTLGLGIATAVKINTILKIQEISLPQISFWKFIFYFLLATLLIFLISRFLKFKKAKGLLFKGLFVLTVFWGGALLISAWFPDVFALILMAILIFYWLKNPPVLVQDICIILGIAGVGSIMGLRLNPLIVVLLLVVFSIYDFIAVYKTKHMTKMAREMIESRAILALIIPPNISAFQEKLEKIQPGGRFLILGGGDIAFPLLLAASLVSEGVLTSLIVAFFSLIGLFISFYLFTYQRVRQPIPALPPIALFSILGYLLTRLF